MLFLFQVEKMKGFQPTVKMSETQRRMCGEFSNNTYVLSGDKAVQPSGQIPSKAHYS